MSSSLKYGSDMSLINRNMAIEIAQEALNEERSVTKHCISFSPK